MRRSTTCFPFGRGQRFLAKNRYAGLVAGGCSLSGIVKLRQGFPLQITTQAISQCLTSANAYQGVCMPDYNPSVLPSGARQNGRWGRAPGANASNIQTIQYLNPAAFQYPDGNAASYKIGNVARSAPDGLRGPGYKDLDLGIRRTFTLREQPGGNLTFQVEADVINATYFTINTASTQWNTCTAGATLQACPAQLYGTVVGQNNAVAPRDWQFAGRFRF